LKNIPTILLLILFGLNKNVQAQEYNVWQFFGAKLDFTSEPPSYIYNLDGISSFPASICNDSGQLQFYTGGYFELNYLAYSLKNGNGDVLILADSAFNIATRNRHRNLFFRIDDTLYYLIHFTSRTDFGDPPGMYYTLLNKNLNNGKGGIVPGQLNVRISDLPLNGIAGCQASDGSWWLISSLKDSIFAFHATQNGINPLPTISPINENQFPEKYKNWPFALNDNMMRFSHDGKKLIRCSQYYTNLSLSGEFHQAVVFLYEFDQKHGKFSNPIRIFLDTFSSGNSWPLIISDIEISPDNSKTYFLFDRSHENKMIADSSESILSQLNLNASNIETSLKTIYSVADDTDSFFRNSQSIQLGMNGKIYLGGVPDKIGIGIIQYPNELGKNCRLFRDENFRTQGCINAKGTSYAGCYTDFFPFSRYHNLHMDFDYEARCSDSALHLLNLSDTSKFNSYKWYVYSSTNDGQLLDSSEEKEPYFASIKGGRYYVKLRAFTPKGYGPWFSDTIEHINPALPFANFSTVDSFACRYAKIQFMDLSDLVKVNPRKAPSWTWKFSDGKDTTLYNSGSVYHAFSELGSYDAKLIVSNGFCADSLEKKKIVTVIDAPKPGILATPTQGCQALEVSFERRYSDSILKAEYRFGDGSPAEFPSISPNNQASGTHVYSTPGVYWLSQYITGPTGCISDDSIPIHVLRGFYPGEQADIHLASVQGDSAIELLWDSLAPAKEFQLQRSSNLLKWENVFSNPSTELVDYKVDPQQDWYQYRMMAKDTCGKSVTGLPGTSIHLTGDNKDNSVILLKWNPYETWPNGVYTYALEYKNALGNWLPVIQSQSTTFNDKDFEVDGEEYRCYRVRALNDQNASLESYSNTECVKFLPLIWVPNAFSPNNDGHNDIFQTTCIGISELEIRIYNRYGQLIHTATGINATWDGTLDGMPVPSGVYIYQITGRTSSEQVFFHQEGSVTLLR